MAIDVRLTDREVVLLMTLCRLMGKAPTMRDAEEACLDSIQQVKREIRALSQPDSEES
jgi:hypothetical protein